MAEPEPRSYLDPRTHGADTIGGVARVLVLTARAARAESRGKSTKHLEKRLDRIQDEANARFDARYGDRD